MSTNKDRIPWSEWRVKAQKAYVKGKYTSQNMIHDWEQIRKQQSKLLQN